DAWLTLDDLALGNLLGQLVTLSHPVLDATLPLLTHTLLLDRELLRLPLLGVQHRDLSLGLLLVRTRLQADSLTLEHPRAPLEILDGLLGARLENGLVALQERAATRLLLLLSPLELGLGARPSSRTSEAQLGAAHH